MTIEERAEEGCLEQYSPKCWMDGYIKGATEQRNIDIDKACMWLENWFLANEWLTMQESLERFRKAMEE